MSNAQLRVDTDTLKRAGTSLSTISKDFGNANDYAKDVASLLGSTGVSGDVANLANAIRSFATNWDDRRKKLKESIDALATATTQIGQAFEDTDAQLGKAIQSEAPTGVAMASDSSGTPSASGGSGASASSPSAATSGQSPVVGAPAGYAEPVSSSASPQAGSDGSINANIDQIRARAEQELEDLDRRLADLRARLAALHDEIRASVEALQIHQEMEAIIIRRDYILSLIHDLSAAPSDTHDWRIDYRLPNEEFINQFMKTHNGNYFTPPTAA